MTRARDTANVVPLASADLWRLTADITGTDGDITADLERADDTVAGSVGGMTETSGVFSFPSTGVWLVQAIGSYTVAANDGSVLLQISGTADNGGAWDVLAQGLAGNEAASAVTQTSVATAIVDVTDVAQVKVKFTTDSLSASSILRGDTDQNETHFLFLRVGNT